MALENLKSLKDDMVSKKWTICSYSKISLTDYQWQTFI